MVVAAATVMVSGYSFFGSKEASKPFQLRGDVDSRGTGFATALYQTVGVRMVPGNQLRWANNGAVFDVMAEELSRARSSMNIVLFIWRPGAASERLLSVITERARAGVACRVLVDPLGSGPFEKEVKPRLDAAGCKAHLFRPLPADENLARNHRKVIVVRAAGGAGARGRGRAGARAREQERPPLHHRAPARHLRHLEGRGRAHLGVPAVDDAREDDAGG
jgi:cardiolipin synthase